MHVTLALFLATFTYALTVLRTVRSSSERQTLFVPQIAVTAAFLLTLVSVFALVLFLAHLAQEIRVETMLRNVHADVSASVRHALPERGEDARARAVPTPPPAARALLAGNSGFLVRVDEDAVLAAAVGADAIVRVDRSPGDSLVAGVPVGSAWRREGGDLGGFEEGLRAKVADALLTAAERTAQQDTAFGLRQITDVATKALSPGINDPTTAVHALGHASALIGELVGRDLGPRVLRDDEGTARVWLARPDLAALLDLTVSPCRRYGASDPDLLARLLQLLREVGWLARDERQREVVAAQLDRLRTTVADGDIDTTARAWLYAAVEQVRDALEHRWDGVQEGGSEEAVTGSAARRVAA